MDQEAASVVRRWAAREIIASVDHNETLLLQKTADARVAFAMAILDATLVGATAIVATAPFA